MSCQKNCLQNAVVDQCKCKAISLPGSERFPNVKYCTNDDDVPLSCHLGATPECQAALEEVYKRFICVRDRIAVMSRNATFAKECGCFPSCDEISYDVTYSLSKWPAESFDGEEAYIDIFKTTEYPARFSDPADAEKNKMYSEYFDASNRKECMKDFARINVYIADSNILKTMEAEDFSTSQLLSDIGGQLGLWVGISVITLAEVLELVIDVCRLFMNRHGPYSNGRTFSKEQTYSVAPGGPEDCRHRMDYRDNKLNGTIPLKGIEDPGHLV